MIQDTEIEEFARTNALTPHEVEKDYVHSWLLSAIYSRPYLSSQLILKGGNGLRKAYLPNTRFSKDLDFSVQAELDRSRFESELREAVQVVEAQTGVRFLDKQVLQEKNLPFDVNALEARLYFKGFYNEEKVALKAQLDVTEFDRIFLPIQSRAILHPYSDAGALIGVMRCQKAEEILASKLTTLLHRRKAADMFDLLFGIVLGGYQVARREVITTFLRKSIFEAGPDTARNELLGLPLEEFDPLWGTISVPQLSAFSFEVVRAQFPLLINSLFDLAATQERSQTPLTLTYGVGGGMNVGRSSGFSFGSFAGATRQTIISAGRSLRMIELTYGGYRRLVEPYKLEYYVRKSDHVGNEYFWGYDTTGGSSGRTSIKQFFADKIQSAQISDRAFVPRYPVEL